MKELRGLPVAEAITEECKKDIIRLAEKGTVPCLAVVRIGAREDDISYEKGIVKRFSGAGARVEINELAAETGQEALEEKTAELNENPNVHGILLFRPLPKTLSEPRIKGLILPSKDIDCMSAANIAAVFEGGGKGFAPCTPGAVIELLDFYGIELTGKKVTVVGRSMVVGRPLAMMLLARNATVTLCHTKTLNLNEECKNADIVICCAGRARMLGAEAFRSGQTVVDVGINMEEGRLCGDVDFDAVKELAEAITPVPGGVGTVTTAVLLKNTVKAAGN